jgi:uncharacterized repeat protein (TIGR03803 family)
MEPHRRQTNIRAASARIGSVALTLMLLPIVVIGGMGRAGAQSYQVIYNFTGVEDGTETDSALTIDQNGNLYGASPQGGNIGGACTDLGCGTIFKLSNNGSAWNLTVLYAFGGLTDGATPYSTPVFGPGGALYGTTLAGGTNGGTVFALKPASTACVSSPCAWIHTVIYDFNGLDGTGPAGDVIFNQLGTLYGTTLATTYTYGSVYTLTPSGRTWTHTTLYSFPEPTDGDGPWDGVIMDSAGNLYGVTYTGGAYGWGTVFELTPSDSGWQEHILHDFTNGSDGRFPLGALIFDHSGNLFGSTTAGARNNGGTLFELTPSGDGWAFKTIHTFDGTGGPHDRLTIDASGNPLRLHLPGRSASPGIGLRAKPVSR